MPSLHPNASVVAQFLHESDEGTSISIVRLIWREGVFFFNPTVQNDTSFVIFHIFLKKKNKKKNKRSSNFESHFTFHILRHRLSFADNARHIDIFSTNECSNVAKFTLTN